MTGRRLSVLAAALAGGAVVTWTIIETLREPAPDEQSAVEAAADSPITRLVARVGPPDRTPGAWSGWEAWSREAADLRMRGDLTGGIGDGALGDRRGRAFWDAWARRVDRADGRSARLRSPDGARSARRGDPALRGHQPYRDPRTGVPTILTSGRRLGRADMRLPHSAAVSLGLDDQERVSVRAEVCVDHRGRPDEVRIVEGTGNEAVDTYVAREMLAGRYRPLSRDGHRVGFCERTTVILGM